jgi:hypothetical protein
VLEALETSAVVAALTTGGMEDALTFSKWSILGVGIIDLDETELSSNDREILYAVVERVFADPSVLEAEDPEIAASVAAATADAGVPSNTALAPDAVVSEQPAPSQGGDVGRTAPSTASEAVEGLLGGLQLERSRPRSRPHSRLQGRSWTRPTLDGRAGEEVTEAAEPSSVQSAVAFEVVAPATSQPTTAPQEHIAPEGAMRATSQEIQETGEGSGAALPRGAGGDDDRVLDLARIPWAAAFEVGDNAEEDEESATRYTLERGVT